ncbi:MAG: O-antigen ligase family protein [Candidatus Magasanikbacteria bacterium]
MCMITQRWFTYILGILYAGVILFVFPNAYAEPFEFPKYILLISGSLFLLFMLVPTLPGLIKSTKEIQLPLFFLAIFFVGQIIAFIFHPNYSLALFGAIPRYQGLLSYLSYIILFIAGMAYALSKSHTEQKKLFKIISISAIVSCVVGYLSYTNAIPILNPLLFENRVFSTLGNPNIYAAVICASMFFIFLYQPRAHYKWIIYIFFALALVSIILSESRSSILFLILLACAYLLYKMKTKTYAVLAASLMLIIMIFSTALYIRRSDSIHTRVDIWKSSVSLITSRILVGYGHDYIAPAMREVLPLSIQNNNDHYVDQMHNALLDVLFMHGIVAFVGYVGLGYITIRRSIHKLSSAIKTHDRLFIFCFISLVSLVVYTLFNSPSITISMMIFFTAGFLCVYPRTTIS